MLAELLATIIFGEIPSLTNEELEVIFSTEIVAMTSSSRQGVETFYPNGRYVIALRTRYAETYQILDNQLCISDKDNKLYFCRRFSIVNDKLYVTEQGEYGKLHRLDKPILCNLTDLKETIL